MLEAKSFFILAIKSGGPGKVARAYNPSTLEAEAGTKSPGLAWVMTRVRPLSSKTRGLAL